MTTPVQPAFELLNGGKPTPPPPAEEPDPNAPIPLGAGGVYEPKLGRLGITYPGSFGLPSYVFTDETTARRIAAIVEQRGVSAVCREDFNDARRALVEHSAALCLAGSRAYPGFVALYRGTRTAQEGSAMWSEFASFDRALSGVAASLALALLGSAPATSAAGWKFDLWSVPKERRRCGLHLRAGNKEGTTIQAKCLLPELALDWQILILSTPILRDSAAAA